MFPYKNLFLGGLVALILIGGGYFIMNKRTPIGDDSNLSGIREGLKREVVAEGKIVAELPQDLVLPGTKLLLSSKAPTQDGFMLSVSLTTKESVETTLERYVAYFRTRDYTVEKEFNNGMASIVATKQGHILKVGIFKGENRTNTSIAIMELIK